MQSEFYNFYTQTNLLVIKLYSLEDL